AVADGGIRAAREAAIRKEAGPPAQVEPLESLQPLDGAPPEQDREPVEDRDGARQECQGAGPVAAEPDERAAHQERVRKDEDRPRERGQAIAWRGGLVHVEPR